LVATTRQAAIVSLSPEEWDRTANHGCGKRWRARGWTFADVAEFAAFSI
jgi:hypothetical protein